MQAMNFRKKFTGIPNLGELRLLEKFEGSSVPLPASQQSHRVRLDAPQANQYSALVRPDAPYDLPLFD